MKILEGVRVLDFGRYIAGPYCAAILADFGADTIRVEKVDGSEDRFVGPVGETGDGAMFLQCNRGKRGLTLNPMKPGGREIVDKLVDTADVVVANLPPNALAAMGLDYETLSARKPEIILTTTTAYGSGGPSEHKLGFDGIGQAMCGSLHLTGDPDAPMRASANWVDFSTAISSALGTLAALLQRKDTGRGQHVQTSLLGSAISLFNPTLIEQDLLQIDRVATRNRSQLAGPSDVFQAADGWIIVQTVGRPLFERWARLVGEEALLEDPRFTDDKGRGDHGAILSERMAAWCSERTVAQALGELEAAQIPAGPVYTPQQALDDPHVQAVGFMQPVEYPGTAKPAPVARAPVQLSDSDVAIRGRAPLLGEHTDEILGSLGYDAAAIEAFRAGRVV